MNAIPRVALVWLLVAQVLVILPHLAYMPLWIAAMWLSCSARARARGLPCIGNCRLRQRMRGSMLDSRSACGQELAR
ncbi:hypothetical protein IGA98_32895, partial [Pseudomonas aeruginosa]|uniref:hypothetical protein n=1 Tax=Pseudomonas aeruginosa TaxID=287 RepID=UPI002238A517